MQLKRQLSAASLSLVDWLFIERALQVPAKKVLFFLFSLTFVIASTTHAQETVPDVSVTGRTGTVDHTQVVIMVQNVTCYGRFHDSLKEHLLGKHDWIHKVNIVNTGTVRSPGKTGELPFDIGTIAELTFTIDSSRSTLDLLKAIKDTMQYSLTEWKVVVEIGVEEMLSR